jgi:hypothetical protein
MAKKVETPEIYHETMLNAISAAVKYANDKGYDVIENDIMWNGMPYETYQTKLYQLINLAKKTLDKKCLNISLYRMPTGRYELTTYIN